MHLPDPDSLFVNPQGEWNSSRIVFDNGHVEHWLNGHKILEFEAWTDDWFARKHSGKWETTRIRPCAPRCDLPAGSRFARFVPQPGRSGSCPAKAGREVELFNGKDLTGWEAYGTEKWYVDKDGNMVCESGPDKEYGYLATREYYNDFDLTLEFKQLANGNSGVFFPLVRRASRESPRLAVRSGPTGLRYGRYLRVLRPRLAGSDPRREGRTSCGRASGIRCA